MHTRTKYQNIINSKTNKVLYKHFKILKKIKRKFWNELKKLLIRYKDVSVDSSENKLKLLIVQNNFIKLFLKIIVFQNI